MDQIIVRRDLRNNVAVFKVDSADAAKNTVKVWNGVHGAQWEDASLDYYRSTKPIDDKNKVEEVIKNYSSNFGSKELIVRQRLIKDTAKGSTSPETAPPFDKAQFKKNFMKAIEKALESV